MELLSITVPAPPSANKIWRHVGNKVLKSAEYRQWLKECDALIWSKGWRDLIRGPVRIEIYITPKDKRLRDVDNYAKPCLDLLESSGVIENDKNVEQLYIERRLPRGGWPHTVQIRITALAQTDTQSDRP